MRTCGVDEPQGRASHCKYSYWAGNHGGDSPPWGIHVTVARAPPPPGVCSARHPGFSQGPRGCWEGAGQKAPFLAAVAAMCGWTGARATGLVQCQARPEAGRLPGLPWGDNKTLEEAGRVNQSPTLP